MEEIWNDLDASLQEIEEETTKIAKEKEDALLKSKHFFKENGMIWGKCQICDDKVKISCKYSGEYPLCNAHRNPNDRIANKIQNKNKNQEQKPRTKTKNKH